jgi:hypothetical protein
MEYKKIKPYKMSEDELRQLWADEYCDVTKPIYTFDDILVKFYESMFDHSFYESSDRKARDKSILSFNRLEKILWIKATLQDPEAVLKKGWDRDNKTYDNARRVAFIKNNYVVIIRFTGALRATFVTAYELHDDENIKKIKNSPEWDREDKYYEKK